MTGRLLSQVMLNQTQTPSSTSENMVCRGNGYYAWRQSVPQSRSSQEYTQNKYGSRPFSGVVPDNVNGMIYLHLLQALMSTDGLGIVPGPSATEPNTLVVEQFLSFQIDGLYMYLEQWMSFLLSIQSNSSTPLTLRQ